MDYLFMDSAVIPIIKAMKAEGFSGLDIYQYLLEKGFEITWLEFQQIFNTI